jgi:hypothetical protein
VEILLLAELFEAQKIATKGLAEGNAQNIEIQKNKISS